MRKSGKWIFCCGMLVVLLFSLTACSQSKTEVTQAITKYMDHLLAAEYEEAYAMLSDFDKSNISEAQFVRWRELAVEIAPLESFTVNGKVDNFKDYSYRGTSLGHCYGVMVEGKANVLVPDVNLSTYDKESFRIMLQQDGKDYRVLLLLTQLDDIVTQYEAYTAP